MSKDNDLKVIFFFGAGAEVELLQPSGYDYKNKTFLSKNENLLIALKKYYDNILDSDKSSKYREYVSNYSKNVFSIDLKRMLFKGILTTIKASDETMYYRILEKYFNPNDEDILSKVIKEINFELDSRLYNRIIDIANFEMAINEFIENIKRNPYKEQSFRIEDIDFIEGNYKLKQTILENITGYGDLEKYFHILILPNKYGKNKVWKLINYYWSCWFEIIESIFKYLYKNNYIEESIYFKIEEESIILNYSKILDEIPLVIDLIYSEIRDMNFQTTPYYDLSRIQEEIDGTIFFVTTNYTPYLKQSFFNVFEEKDDEKIAYLHGEINIFENPYKRSLYKICEKEMKQTDFIFPYILGQSAIKPIISSYQVNEFSKFNNMLIPNKNVNKVLIMVGYALNEDDSHIISSINEFLKEKNHILIYYKFLSSMGNDSEVDIENLKNNIINILRVDYSYHKKIQIETISFNDDFYKKVSKKLKTIKF